MMKHKFFRALDETPFVLFLAVMSNMWVVAGLLVVILCILSSVLKLKDIPMALFIIATSHMSIWISLVVIFTYVVVKTLDFQSYDRRKIIN
jgi:hypothetical protein